MMKIVCAIRGAALLRRVLTTGYLRCSDGCPAGPQARCIAAGIPNHSLTCGKTTCPTSWMRSCRTSHHSTSGNPLSPLFSMASPLMVHMGVHTIFYHCGKYGPSPKGCQFTPFPQVCHQCTSYINWCYLWKGCGW